MNASNDVVNEIKARVDIEDVVGRYVELKRSGSSLKGLCPFHQEKTPSFHVSPQRGQYHCFGCGRGGDVFQFVMEMEHLGFPDALRRLGEQAGVAIPERQQQRPSLKGRLYEANEAAARIFTEALQTREGERATAYLYERGFGSDAVGRFTLGYAPRGGDVVSRRLQEEGFDTRTLLAAGLAVEDEGSGKPRDRFRGRLIFPIRDAAGKISGFGGRVLGDGLPKYLNSPQTEIFDKSSVLYGIHLAQDDIRRSRRAVLVEGYLDAVRAHLSGFSDTVASLGTAVTAQQLGALARLAETVVLALDPDAAGQSAAARTALGALAELTQRRSKSAAGATLDLRIARIPAGEGDPDELIAARRERWAEVIDAAVPAFDFYFTQMLDGIDRSTPSWREDALNQLLPVIQQFAGSPGRQAVWIERLAGETGIGAAALLRALPGAPAGTRRPARRSPDKDVVSATTARGLAGNETEQIEASLMALLLQLLVIPREAAKSLDGIQLQREEHRVLLSNLLTWQNYDYELFREGLPEHVQQLADALRATNVPLPADGKLSAAVQLHLARLRRARLQEELTRATELLKTMAPEDGAARASYVTSLTREKLEVDGELRALQQIILQGGHRHATPSGND